ncbi:MAG TPA: hypothetical protein VL495_02825 [Edaphobacter sp.]|nr:hypothetical protein [Edaphobacter sp.]
MTKTLSLVSLAMVAISLQAQTPASPQAGSTMTPSTAQASPQQAPQAARQAVKATSVSAELTKGINSKKAKVGDEVNAKTTDSAKLPDGTELPKGTKLVGNIVDVKPKAKDEKNSHLVLSLNRAVMKDGHDVPIRAAVTSMTAPTTQSASMDMPAGGGMAPGGGGGSASGGGSSSGATAAPSAPTMASDVGSGQAQSTQGQMLKSAQDHVAVGNMPKVMLSAPTTPDSAGVLDGVGDNISLDSGTKFTANVILAQTNAGGA